ncbi:MAG TPA: carboxypeptidase regulatory-like domain-containing protein [Gemmataceae bacterium]|jgi:hypothetical protein
MRATAVVSALWAVALVPTAPAAPAPGTALTGAVVAVDGTPAAGATVWAVRQTYGLPDRRETAADARGTFAFDLPPGRWSFGARRGTQGGELPAASRWVEVVAGRTPDVVTIRLEERGTLRGRLLAAETGRPAAGAWLALGGGLVLTAGADGRFEIGGLARGFHMGHAGGPGRERRRVLFDTTGRADTELDVTLRAGGTVTGRVTDADGKPVPGAYVGDVATGFEPCAADGRFVYHGLPLDVPDRLSAAAPGHQGETLSVTAAAGQPPAELHFRLRPVPPGAATAPGEVGERGRALTGIVRGPDGKPVEGALVRWGAVALVGAPQARTGPDGRFRVTGVPDKEGTVAVFARGLQPAFPTVLGGGDQTLELALEAGRTVAGFVRDDAGTPLANVWVAPVMPNQGPGPFMTNGTSLSEHVTWTGPDGSFKVAGLPDNVRFTFQRAGLTDLRDVKLTGTENVVLMEHGGAIRGRVVDKDGKPVRTFRVRLTHPRQPVPGNPMRGIMVELINLGLTFTAGDGGFLVSGLAADGVYRVTVAADGHGEAEEDPVTAVPLNRLPAEPPTFRLGPPAALRVRGVATGGGPVAGARVTLVNYELPPRQIYNWGSDERFKETVRATTDAAGAADFPALSFGAGTVLVRASGYARYRADWRRGQTELTAELAKEAVVAAQVRGPAGAPFAKGYWRLAARPTGDDMTGTMSPADGGRLRITEIPAGTWTLTVYGPDGRSAVHTEQVIVKAGEVKDLTIDVMGE